MKALGKTFHATETPVRSVLFGSHPGFGTWQETLEWWATPYEIRVIRVLIKERIEEDQRRIG